MTTSELEQVDRYKPLDIESLLMISEKQEDGSFLTKSISMEKLRDEVIQWVRDEKIANDSMNGWSE
jgi:hypothetical protein